MKPVACPPYAWIKAAEDSVILGLAKPNFWSWSRKERSHILLAALNSVPEGLCKAEYLSLETFQDVWEASYAAALEVLNDRKIKKRMEKEKRIS